MDTGYGDGLDDQPPPAPSSHLCLPAPFACPKTVQTQSPEPLWRGMQASRAQRRSGWEPKGGSALCTANAISGGKQNPSGKELHLGRLAGGHLLRGETSGGAWTGRGKSGEGKAPLRSRSPRRTCRSRHERRTGLHMALSSLSPPKSTNVKIRPDRRRSRTLTPIS